MQSAQQKDIQRVFRGISDPSRRQIIRILADGPQSIKEIANTFDTSRTAIVKHLKVLEEAGLIFGSVAGRTRLNHLNPEPLKHAFDWLLPYERFWDRKLAVLKSIIEDDLHDKS